MSGVVTVPEVFVSHCDHEEEEAELCKEIVLRLDALKEDGVLDYWWDGDFEGGEDRDAEIKRHLQQCHIGILLVSPSWRRSEPCKAEKRKLLERRDLGEVTLLPIPICGQMPPDLRGIWSQPKHSEPLRLQDKDQLRRT